MDDFNGRGDLAKCGVKRAPCIGSEVVDVGPKDVVVSVGAGVNDGGGPGGASFESFQKKILPAILEQQPRSRKQKEKH